MSEFPTSFDIYIEEHGQKVAVVQNYQAKQREDGQYVIHLDRVYPLCDALKDGIHELDDFSLVVCKPDRKIVYSGCQWSEIYAAGTLGDMATERVVVTAKERKEAQGSEKSEI